MADCGGGEGAGNEVLRLPRVNDVRIDDRQRRIVGAEGKIAKEVKRREIAQNSAENVANENK
jgi:hypothetical protein